MILFNKGSWTRWLTAKLLPVRCRKYGHPCDIKCVKDKFLKLENVAGDLILRVYECYCITIRVSMTYMMYHGYETIYKLNNKHLKTWTDILAYSFINIDQLRKSCSYRVWTHILQRERRAWLVSVCEKIVINSCINPMFLLDKHLHARLLMFQFLQKFLNDKKWGRCLLFLYLSLFDLRARVLGSCTRLCCGARFNFPYECSQNYLLPAFNFQHLKP